MPQTTVMTEPKPSATADRLAEILGSAVAWILEAVAFGGALMDIQMGYSFAQLLDPATGQSASLSGTLLGQVAALIERAA